jgi:hypothetical protein
MYFGAEFAYGVYEVICTGSCIGRGRSGCLIAVEVLVGVVQPSTYL